MGTPLLSGRDFTQHDVDTAAPVAVVNQTFASSFWPGQGPLGKRFRLNSNMSGWIEVIGLAPDGKYQRLGEQPQRHLYLAGGTGLLTLVLHTGTDPHQYAQAVTSVVHGLDLNLPVTDLQTMNEHLGLAFYPARMGASLLGFFSVLGLLLAMLGLYGLLAFVVRRRTHEVGIRMALGARKRDVVALMMRQGISLVALGMALGLGAAYAATHVVAGMLYGIGGRDLVTFIGISLVLGFVALVAMYIPARRAARVDPMVALRYE